MSPSVFWQKSVVQIPRSWIKTVTTDCPYIVTQCASDTQPVSMVEILKTACFFLLVAKICLTNPFLYLVLIREKDFEAAASAWPQKRECN